MTLLLTCVTPRFTVQASDRRLTQLDGKVLEDAANKAVIWSYFGSFAFTGLAQSSRTVRTDEMAMRALAKPYNEPGTAMRNLADEATRTIGRVKLAGVRPNQVAAVRRTSLVGCGFFGLRDPAAMGRSPVDDDLHPFLGVVSNAQTLAMGWRPRAEPQFGVHWKFLPEDEPFLLHEAGQSVPRAIRDDLERTIGRCVDFGVHAEAVARLLARAIREVSTTNSAVGPNVMCTFVHREDVRSDKDIVISSGPAPLVPEVMNEKSYFTRMKGPGPAPRYIYSPAEVTALVHEGPLVAYPDLQIKDMKFGPSSLAT